MIFPEHDRSFHTNNKTDAAAHPKAPETQASADFGTNRRNDTLARGVFSGESDLYSSGRTNNGFQERNGAISSDGAGSGFRSRADADMSDRNGSGFNTSPGGFNPNTDIGMHDRSDACLPDRFNIRLPDKMIRTRTHYCRLATPALSIDGLPVTCYSLLAFELEELVVTDHVFIFDITRSKKAFERLVRIARREQLSPTQLSYLAEDMIGAGLL